MEKYKNFNIELRQLEVKWSEDAWEYRVPGVVTGECEGELDAIEEAKTAIDNFIQTTLKNKQMKAKKETATKKAETKKETATKKAETKKETATKKAETKKETATKKAKPPGVIASILEFIKEAKNPISEKQILSKLVKRFPERAENSMQTTIKVQISGKKRPSRMEREKKVVFKITIINDEKHYFL